MFRQTIILACLIAVAASSESDWFEIGTRVDGDQNILNQTSRSYPSDSPRVHVVYTAFAASATNSFFTFSRFDVEEVSFVNLFLFKFFKYLFFCCRVLMIILFMDLTMDLRFLLLSTIQHN